MWSCLSSGQRDEKANHWWVHVKQQVPARATAGQSEALWWALSCQAVPQTEEVREPHFKTSACTVCEISLDMLSYCHIFPPLRYCVLLITGDEETFSFGNQAFLSFASTNGKEVVRFAYVYQRLQQPLCDILMQNKDSAQSPTQVRSYTSNTFNTSTVNLWSIATLRQWKLCP